MPPEKLILIAIMAFFAGLGKGGFGAALAGVIVPISSIFIDVREAVILSLPLYMVGDWVSIYMYRKDWDKRIIAFTLPTAVLGIILGTYLLTNLSGDTLRLILGIMTLTIGIYKLVEARLKNIQYSDHWWHGSIAGFFAGIGASLASAGGPVYTAYLLLRDTSPKRFIGTSAVFFAVVNIIRVPALAQQGLFDRQTLEVLIWFVPLVLLGVYLGRKFVIYVNPGFFERMMTVILLISGVLLLIG